MRLSGSLLGLSLDCRVTDCYGSPPHPPRCLWCSAPSLSLCCDCIIVSCHRRHFLSSSPPLLRKISPARSCAKQAPWAPILKEQPCISCANGCVILLQNLLDEKPGRNSPSCNLYTKSLSNRKIYALRIKRNSSLLVSARKCSRERFVL